MNAGAARTPAGIELVALTPDGESRNITEGVQVLYDHLIQSMDWGSRFLTVEDVEPIVELAKTCGFRGFEETERYIEKERKAEKQRQCSHEWRTEILDDESVRHVCTSCGVVTWTTPRADR